MIHIAASPLATAGTIKIVPAISAALFAPNPRKKKNPQNAKRIS